MPTAELYLDCSDKTRARRFCGGLHPPACVADDTKMVKQFDYKKVKQLDFRVYISVEDISDAIAGQDMARRPEQWLGMLPQGVTRIVADYVAPLPRDQM